MLNYIIKNVLKHPVQRTSMVLEMDFISWPSHSLDLSSTSLRVFKMSINIIHLKH